MYSRLLNVPGNQSYFLFGPRGVGKTAWLRAAYPNAIYFDLLDSQTYTQFLSAPNRLGDMIPAKFNAWIVLDEIQRVPELLNEVHRLIEARGVKFALTGSSARKLRGKGVNLLAGRALTRYLHPLTATELGADFNLEKKLRYGGLPFGCTTSSPAEYLKSYVATYLREEVLQEGLTRNLGAFSRFLEAASFSQGSVLNMAAVSRECAISSKVAEDYFVILEDLLIGYRLPVFSKRAKRRIVTHPKFYFFDSGVFQAIRPRGPLDSSQEINGAACETLVLQELRAVNDYHLLGFKLFYWRTATGHKVDFILYGENGFLGIEVKTSAKISPDDLKGLESFRAEYPSAKLMLVYAGKRRWTERNIEIIPLAEFLPGLLGFLTNR
ncbi:MAG: AAA family ATPase [Verrucomicrobiota bacterium]